MTNIREDFFLGCKTTERDKDGAKEEQALQENINFVLSHKLTHICTPADYRLLGMVFNACENFKPMSAEEQQALMEARSQYELIF